MREIDTRALLPMSSQLASLVGGATRLLGAAKQVEAKFVDADTKSETAFEIYLNYVLGFAFFVIAAVATRRMWKTRQHNTAGAETTVVTAFYSLILATVLLRFIYFIIPASIWQPSYTPVAVYAWDKEHPSWLGYALAELTITSGSLSLFSIFLLILVYWADILKKYYNPGTRRTLPMAAFLTLVVTLVSAEILNFVLFLLNIYTTEGMILFNAVLLASISIICVAEISIFSRKFQNVLKTLGAINQVSTDGQLRRIVWITITGNLFFVTRATLETVISSYLVHYWWKNGTVSRVFSHVWWDVYTIMKYISELTILALMLHILQSRFSSSSTTVPSQSNSAGYTKVPDSTSTEL